MYSINARRKEASPNRMSLDKHSCRIAPTQRSANAFRFGLLGGRANGVMPLDRRTKCAAELGVAIMKKVPLAAEETGTLIGCVASHLQHPFGGRMFG